MADSRAQELVRIGEGLFSGRTALDSLWQTIADNFYVERADFTHRRYDGEEFADHLFTSFPQLVRRELADVFSSNLRPRSLQWFEIVATNENLNQAPAVRRYLEHRSKTMWRAMYDPIANLVGATKSADHDFATFGNAILEVCLTRDRDALLHKCRHPRDCAWLTNSDGKVDTMFMKWEPTARQLVNKYGTKVSKETLTKSEKEPDAIVSCYITSVPERTFQRDDGGKQFPWTVLAVEKEDEHILEQTSEDWFRFVVPRWHKVSGSQYAYSPATTLTLPDAKTTQVVVRTLREAGEMHVNPPMASKVDALMSDPELYPGGLTPIDIDFEGKLDEAIAPIQNSPSTMPVGFEIAAALKEDMRAGFFLDKIRLPDINSKVMTAFEFQERLKDHIRAASPIFEPIEDEYNDPLIKLDHAILEANGAFPVEEIPQELQGEQIEFKFRSPLRDVQDAAKAGKFLDGLQRVILPAMQVDPTTIAGINIGEAQQDALKGIDWPAEWLNGIEAIEQAKQQQANAQTVQTGIDALQRGGEAASAVGEGAAMVEEALGEA